MQNFRDPRLANPLVLLLAGRRLQHRRLHPPPPSWEAGEGLYALLQAAGAFPPCDPWALPDLDEAGSFGRLLAEAQRWQQEHGHGT